MNNVGMIRSDIYNTLQEPIEDQVFQIDDSNVHLWVPVSLPKDNELGSKVRYALRSVIALRMRASGLSYQRIADILSNDDSIGHLLPKPYGISQVRNDVTYQLNQMRDEINESLLDVVTLELERFDQMLHALWARVLLGDVRSINAALKISERRCRLLGIETDAVQIDWKSELTILMRQGNLTLDDLKQNLSKPVLSQFLEHLGNDT